MILPSLVLVVVVVPGAIEQRPRVNHANRGQNVLLERSKFTVSRGFLIFTGWHLFGTIPPRVFEASRVVGATRMGGVSPGEASPVMDVPR